MAFTFFMRDQPTLEHAADHMIGYASGRSRIKIWDAYKERVEVFRMFHKALAPGGYLATENTQKLPPEVAHLFQQVVPDAQLYKKIGG
ncbi:Chemotaxis protein methyltransferase CheR [Citrifermentans bremense]|uniref:Uncharacterized protein n=2 Tax=Geobacteraceae TaxID=213422 RepID=A0ABQ0MJN4_9BACT|nr:MULTISPECIES: hypothetical protein [Geobacteraceae]BCG46498.1 Chemotaxis protein methyltransferase CheR [Citrifermentans bremense]GAW67032.1 hypothetical protein GPEL0_01r2649 [Geoanaerobacter pelophilus]